MRVQKLITRVGVQELPELHRTLSIPSWSTSDPKLLTAARRTFPGQRALVGSVTAALCGLQELLCSEALAKVPRLHKGSWRHRQEHVSDDFRISPLTWNRTDLDPPAGATPGPAHHPGDSCTRVHLCHLEGALETPGTHRSCRPQLKTDRRDHEADGVSWSWLCQGRRSRPSPHAV